MSSRIKCQEKRIMLFFELLQVTLDNRERLSRVPSAEEWADIFSESKRQAVTGILIHGIDRLPMNQRPSRTLLIQWIGVGQMIEKRNDLLNGRSRELLSDMASAGLHPTILKGQGIAQYYPNEIKDLRQSGDIDVYISEGRKRAIAYTQSKGQKNIDWDYKHLQLKVWDDVEVEMHYRVEVLMNLWKNRKLQAWFENHKEQMFGERNDFVTPTTEFNVFYILLHIYRHFLYEGVGLRQIVDYYYCLRTILVSGSNIQEYVAAVREFGMEKFAKGLMWVMHEVLWMPREWMLWEADEKEGKYILKQVMTGGNFGHHDKRLKHTGSKLGAVKAILTHNLHLITHYPMDTLWSPVWIVWHKMWKLSTV